MSQLQLDDIQGLIPHGYGRLGFASFVLLAVRDAESTKSWLKTLPIRDAGSRPSADDSCVNIAFSYSGLAELGLPESLLQGFAGEFREGMTGTEHRVRILGDHGPNAPEHWHWGGRYRPAVHILLLLYAGSEDSLARLKDDHLADSHSAGLEILTQLDTNRLPEHKEHFGFRDGVAQPAIAGLGANSVDDADGNTIAAGEFLLGYPNAYGQYTARPLLADGDAELDADNLLPPAPDETGMRDLGANGSYLVFRQLGQNVSAFWRYIADQSRRADGEVDLSACTRLAAKMVGRWPGGAPLTRSPDHDDPALSSDNDFLYHRSGDAIGLKCPIGAHIRRTNPRDSLEPQPGSDRSIEVGKRHRILRRGRTYGPALSLPLTAEDLINAEPDGRERGLHFLCFNTHIGRQFEFIQHTWVNNPKFDGLYEDDDPIIGGRGHRDMPGGVFTVQAEPVRTRVTDLPPFVEMKGGEYFFMPGIRAVEFIASLT